MAQGEGPGWHRDKRGHSEAAKKGHDRARAQVRQDARRGGFKHKVTKRPISNEGARFRRASLHTPTSEKEPCLICGEPIPSQYSACPRHGRE
jgi:hypothetical protein